MVDKPTLNELTQRIRRDIAFFGGAMPERTALAWNGYIAALIEWGLISVAEHKSLRDMLPRIEDDPAVTILLGRENQAHTD
jgi:hypothetical protein